MREAAVDQRVHRADINGRQPRVEDSKRNGANLLAKHQTKQHTPMSQTQDRLPPPPAAVARVLVGSTGPSSSKSNAGGSRNTQVAQDSSRRSKEDDTQISSPVSSGTPMASASVKSTSITSVPRPRPRPRPVVPLPRADLATNASPQLADIPSSNIPLVGLSDQRGIKRRPASPIDHLPTKRPAVSTFDLLKQTLRAKSTRPAISSADRYSTPPSRPVVYSPSPMPEAEQETSSAEPEPAAPTTQAKPRQKRIGKKMRERAFRVWLDGVLDDLHAQQAGATDPASDVLVDRSDYSRVAEVRLQGGTTYTTHDAFFAALEASVGGLRAARKRGRRDVLRFCGGYSIVAQPKIGHQLRAQRVKARLREAGIELDEDNAINSRYLTSAQKIDSTWRYPCMCGGVTTGPGGLSMARREGSGSCGGYIWLKVGDDNALDVYNIKGQHIAVRVEH
ncbi:hypothetical protein C8Q78DRAFT_1080484 [Trametes maxima]|nr:hypothetical protein C8Q78DRAFT_1080484 [Trametes maxima]